MDDTYYLHQTPESLAKELIKLVPLEKNDIVYEPFKGEGSFYNNFPEYTNNIWTEITKGRDCEDFSGGYDWIITNPPFRKPEGAGRVNAWWYYLDKFSKIANKGIAFLSNDRCFSTLTPRRIDILNQRGFYLTHINLSSIKKWRGRYYFLIFSKKDNGSFSFYRNTF